MQRTKPPVQQPKEVTVLSAKTQEKLMTLGELIGRAKFAQSLGKEYGGDRDIYQALGYDKEITFDKYAARYSRQDIAKAVINRPISYTWKGDILVAEEGKEDSEFEKSWKDLNKKLKLKSKLVRLDKLSSIGSYGVMLMGLNDVTTDADFKKPVKEGKHELLYVTPITEGSAPVQKYITDPSNERYGLPELYNITFTRGDSDAEVTLVVHYSRILHIVPEPLSSETEGEPPLKGIWNRLMDLEKLTGGSAEMFWRGARPGYQGKIKDDFTLTPKAEEDLQKQIDEYENNLRRMLLNDGVDFQALETQISDPSAHVDIQIQMISAMTGIPKRILTGSERGELSSTQDITSWYALIQTRREEYAEEVIMRPFIDMCIAYKILPKVEDYTIVWSDLFSPSDKEKADVGKIRASTLKEYANSPAAEMIIPPEMFLKLFMGLDEEQLDEVLKAMKDAIAEEERAIAAGEKLDPNAPTEPEEEEDEPKPEEE